MSRGTVSTSIFLIIVLIASIAVAQERSKIRVFISDSDSWEMTGDAVGVDPAIGAQIRGGARPQTAEIVKTFNERCPDLIVTSKQDRADYVVLLQHEGGKDLIRKDNKFVVYNRDGDAIKSGSTRSLGNSVKDACKAIMDDVN